MDFLLVIGTVSGLDKKERFLFGGFVSFYFLHIDIARLDIILSIKPSNCASIKLTSKTFCFVIWSKWVMNREQIFEYTLYLQLWHHHDQRWIAQNWSQFPKTLNFMTQFTKSPREKGLWLQLPTFMERWEMDLSF